MYCKNPLLILDFSEASDIYNHLTFQFLDLSAENKVNRPEGALNFKIPDIFMGYLSMQGSHLDQSVEEFYSHATWS